MSIKMNRADIQALSEKHGLVIEQDRRPGGIQSDHRLGKKRKPKDKTAQVLFAAQCEAHGIPEPVAEFHFADSIGRKWAFDYCWGETDLALEIQGGIWTEGRHVRGQALLDEYEKLSWAAILGWRVMFCTPEQVETGEIFPLIKRAFAEES